MILIYGRLDDPPLSSVVDALQEHGAQYVIVEQGALAREELSLDVGPHGVDGVLVVAGQELPLSSVHSIYARPLELPSDAAKAARARLLQEQLLEWLDVSPALVVNRPRAMRANASKPLQIQLIGEAGFLVPETLVDQRPSRGPGVLARSRPRHLQVDQRRAAPSSRSSTIVPPSGSHGCRRYQSSSRHLFPASIFACTSSAIARSPQRFRVRVSTIGTRSRHGGTVTMTSDRFAAGGGRTLRDAVAAHGAAALGHRSSAAAGWHLCLP